MKIVVQSRVCPRALATIALRYKDIPMSRSRLIAMAVDEMANLISTSTGIEKPATEEEALAILGKYGIDGSNLTGLPELKMNKEYTDLRELAKSAALTMRKGS